MIMMVKIPGAQANSPAVEEEGKEVGEGRAERVESKSTVESTAPKVSLRSRAGEAMNEAPRISPRVSAKSPSSELFLLSSSLAAASQRSR